MPSSTSASEAAPGRPPGWGTGLLALVLPLLVLLLGLGLVRGLGAGGEDPLVAAVSLPPGAAPQVVVVGNSVTESAVDSGVVEASAGLPAGAVARLAAGGLQPAHWLAVVRHQVFGRGLRPGWVVVYAPAHSLGRLRLASTLDRSLLLDLLVRPDEALVRRATGRPGGWWALLLRDRERARDRILRGVGHGPAEAWYGRGRTAPVVEPAMADLFAGRGPATAGPEALDLGLADRAATDTRQAQEATVPLAESWLPALAAEARGAGARLVVVLAAEQGARCADGAALRAELAALGVDVVDLRALPLGRAAFASAHHLRPAGARVVSARLGEALAGPGAAAGAVPRVRVPGCPGTGQATVP